MPKLKEDSLKKRYTCQYCGKSFPTKQGLAGHIQFKHQKKWIKEPDLPSLLEIAPKLKYVEDMFETTVPMDDKLDMITYWPEFKSLCLALNVELNQQDLKHYIIANLVQIHQNQRLKEKIINVLIGLTGK
jgi:competence CoiA-like predicted nuclease